MSGPAPAKPWQRAGSGTTSSSVSPLGPGTAATGAAKPWEQPQSSNEAAIGSATAVTRTAPWSNNAPTFAQPSSSYNSGVTSYSGSYGGYGQGGMYNSGGYGGSMYGRPGYGSSGYGSQYGGGYGMGSGMGTGMYSGGYGMGGGYGGGGMYGGGSYGNTGPYGGPQGNFGPEGPPQAPGAWQAIVHGLGAIVTGFSRVAMLVDTNTQSMHFFVEALLRMLDGFGRLYGELARFVLRMLGYGRPKKIADPSTGAIMPSGAPGQPQPTFVGASGQQRQMPGGAQPAGVPPSLGRGGATSGSGFDAAWDKKGLP